MENLDFKKIIDPVDRELIEKELVPERFVRKTNKGDNEIYVINYHNAPNTLREIGRLREIAFRHSGGGTGLELDLDDYDMSERCYEQLIVYNREDREIIGGYRYITGERAYNADVDEYELSTSHYFEFSEQMKRDYLSHSIELGRSFVQPDYQPSVNPRKGLFALMNIWDGLGSLILKYPGVKYLFGKVTMYTTYDKVARDILLSFLAHYFPIRQELCSPKDEFFIDFDDSHFKEYFDEDTPYDEGFKQLNKLLKERGEWIPSLINIYMNLSKTMVTFGTAKNPDFGGVEETGILITIKDIHQDVIERHIEY